MNADDYAKSLLAIVMHREAGGEGRDGMRGVGHVIRNRVNAGWGNYQKVILDKNQFSSMTIHGDATDTLWPRWPNEYLNSCFDIAEQIYSGQDDDITGGALYYANLKIAKSQWFLENIVGKPDLHPQTAQIGQQVFYA